MLLNYLKLSVRLLARNPFFTAINIVGLAIGFASFYALWEYSTTELKADQYHKDYDRIARIGTNWDWTDDGGKTWGHLVIGGSVSSIFPEVKDDYPEVESTLRILEQPGFVPSLVNHGNKIIITIDDQKAQPRVFKEEKVAYADPNLFTFFTIPLVYGEPEKILSLANDVALSQSTAEKYFGKKNPIGELIKLNDSITLKVSGVFQDLPHYTHLNFELVISSIALQNKWNATSAGAWTGWITCYLKLNHRDFKTFEAKLNERIKEFWSESMRHFPNAQIDMFIQPLEEIPFSQNFLGDNFYSKSKPFLFILAFIAFSVLAMAWVNYINLSVTRTTRRFKEIATRKVSGASAGDMVKQFVMESFMTNALAIALAFTLIQIIRKPFSLLFNIQIAEFSSLNPISIGIFLSIILSGILLSGLYPAIISMAHQPRALFNLKSTASGKRFIPSLLTVSQLAVAIIFILLGFTVSHQISHVLNMNTGINKNEVMVIEAPVIKPANYHQVVSSLENQISNNPHVSGVTSSRVDVTDLYGNDNVNTRRIGADLSFGMDGNTVDEDYLSFYGLKLLAGRNFIKDDKPDAIIISRFAATRLGFNSPDDAVGSKINLAQVGGLWKDAEVIGVFEDFRIASFLNMSQSSTEANDQGRGIVFKNKNQTFAGVPSDLEKISIRVSRQNFEETIASIQKLFEQQFPGNAFIWYFLDEHASQVYVHEKTARNQIVLFTALAIGIACLGLLGMISNKVVEKTKEIGIRKVLGAQLHQIAQILLSTTAKQVIIATIIGIPMAYYLTQQYLQKFSERIELRWWHFALPVLILVVIMLATVASVLWKAARSNPVEALKYE
jgi:putative ABC transport system permease protein